MLKIFYSGTYCTRHEFINENNVLDMLKDDIRSKIVGDVKATVYASDGVVIKNNPEVMYVGGFYYEKQDPHKSVCENVVHEELKEIDNADIVIVNLMHYSAIASVTEMLYAALKNKKIVIFCDPHITSYEITGEYWFSILTTKKLTDNVIVKYANSEEDIISFINNLNKESIKNNRSIKVKKRSDK